MENTVVDERFLATAHIKKLDLVRELQISETDFKRIYQSSPILRAKRSGYLRNVALAIGNHRFPETRDILLRVIHTEEESLIRAAAVWAIGQMIDDQVREELVTCLEVEKDASVRSELIQVLNAGE